MYSSRVPQCTGNVSQINYQIKALQYITQYLYNKCHILDPYTVIELYMLTANLCINSLDILQRSVFVSDIVDEGMIHNCKAPLIVPFHSL